MKVRDYMSPAPVTVGTKTDYRKAFGIMEEHDLHHLPVVDDGNHVVGMLARRDLEHAASVYREAPMEVGEIMHTPVVTMEGDSPLAAAADLMRQERFGSLPVVEGKGADSRLVGIITETDLLRALSEMLSSRAA